MQWGYSEAECESYIQRYLSSEKETDLIKALLYTFFSILTENLNFVIDSYNNIYKRLHQNISTLEYFSFYLFLFVSFFFSLCFYIVYSSFNIIKLFINLAFATQNHLNQEPDLNAEIHINQEPTNLNVEIPINQGPIDLNADIPINQEPTDLNADIPMIQEPTDLNADNPMIQEFTELVEQIQIENYRLIEQTPMEAIGFEEMGPEQLNQILAVLRYELNNE